VDKIAQECGFVSAEYFSRAFRREFGLSPRAYRSAHRDRPMGSAATATAISPPAVGPVASSVES
jgi:AraC-like DNA-binding protein